MRGFYFFLGYLILFSFFNSCSPKSSQEKVILSKEVTDDLGRTVKVPLNPQRILPLSPSIMEILYLLIDEKDIVARTQNDSFPLSVLKKPVVNNYPIDYECLITLQPDLILAKEGIINQDDAIKMESLGFPVYYQTYDSLYDVLAGIKDIGKLVNKTDRADYVVDSLNQLLEQLASKVKGYNRPSVLLVISEDPLYVFGQDSYATSLLKVAGGTNAVTKIFDNPFPSIRREYILEINPEVILGVDKHSFFQKYPELKRTRAYISNQVFEVDGEILSRPGPRCVQAIQEIQALLHNEN